MSSINPIIVVPMKGSFQKAAGLASWVLGFPLLFWISAGLISLLSLYGDRREIPPKVRLGIQLLGSIGLLVGLFYWGGRGWFVYLLIPFFAVFIAGTANYYNFMDGINGIAGLTGVVGFGLVACFAVLPGSPSPFLILAVCMSFLGFVLRDFGGLVVGLESGLKDDSLWERDGASGGMDSPQRHRGHGEK